MRCGAGGGGCMRSGRSGAWHKGEMMVTVVVVLVDVLVLVVLEVDLHACRNQPIMKMAQKIS